MNQNSRHLLSADKPLTDPETEDRLGHSAFAKHLAAGIRTMVPQEGLVMALEGPWGSGRTSMLNFLAHYLNAGPVDDRPAIMRFNPWCFAAPNDVAGPFFAQLRVVLNKLGPRGKVIAGKVASYDKALGRTLRPAAVTGTASKTTGPKRLYGGGQALFRRQVVELKEEIAEQLKTLDRKILILMDDVDRLTKEQLRLLFHMVSGIADFPSLIYFAAFDWGVVSDTLEDSGPVWGDEFLDKMVQVRFQLPSPAGTDIRRLLFDRLNPIFEGTPGELIAAGTLADAYDEGIGRFLTNPRDVVHLTNALGVSYPVVKGQVQAVDFILVEALRVFRPAVYEVLRQNRNQFVGPLVDETKDRLTAFHKDWMESLGEEDSGPACRILSLLFPKFLFALGSSETFQPNEGRWREQLRLTSSAVFPAYFGLGKSKGAVYAENLNMLAELAKDPASLEQTLGELTKQLSPESTTRAIGLLEDLVGYAAREGSADLSCRILSILFNVGDEWLKPDFQPAGVFDLPNREAVGRLIGKLLGSLSPSARLQCIRDAMSEGQAVSTIIGVVRSLGSPPGRCADFVLPAGSNLFTEQQLGELRQAA
ncbi:P-loop NTPase fold protein [Thermodesulfobacteriota bacterium]